MTMVSRVFGYLRDMVLAVIFGATGGTDAFFVAFRIPNFMRRLFAEGAFAQAFVPVLSEYKERGDGSSLKDLVDHVAGSLLAILVLITAVGVLAAPILISVFAPGFVDEADRHDLATDMLRLTFPYLLFVSLTAFAGGVLNSFGRFAVPALTPVLLNLSLIGTALWLAPRMAEPIEALAWGVLIAGIAQLLFQLPFLMRLGLLPRPRLRAGHEGVRRVVGLMLPAIFGSSVVQINLLFDTLIASFLASGSISWLYFSDRFVELPLALFGIAIGTVILPRLSRHHASGDARGFSDTLDWGLRASLLVAIPAMVGLICLAGPILATLIQYREFTADDTHMSALSMMAFAFGLPGFILVKVLGPGFFSRQDMRTPVRIGVIAMLANMGLNLLLVVPWTALGVAGPHAGLATATALASYINAGLLYRRLAQGGYFRLTHGWVGWIARIGLAALLMGLVLTLVTPDLDVWSRWGAVQRAAHLLALVALGLGLYGLALWGMGLGPRRLRAQLGGGRGDLV